MRSIAFLIKPHKNSGAARRIKLLSDGGLRPCPTYERFIFPLSLTNHRRARHAVPYNGKTTDIPQKNGLRHPCRRGE
jgi:hypothetical protein